MVWNEYMKPAETSNFLLDIPFASDNTHIEELIRAWNNITWMTDGQVSAHCLKKLMRLLPII
jgi:hypothetical protein